MNREQMNEFIKAGEEFQVAADRILENIQTLKNELQSQLSEPEPLRHGDCGLTGENVPWITLHRKKTLELFSDLGGVGLPPAGKEGMLQEPFFNIFDFLQSLAEPVEEFEIETNSRVVKIEPCARTGGAFIAIIDSLNPSNRKGVQLTLDEAEQFWLKLGSMVLQAKGKK